MSISFDEYAPNIIATLGLKQTSRNEWHGPCPNCGGDDRFWIADHNGSLKHHCRKDCALSDRTRQLEQAGLLPKFEPQMPDLPRQTKLDVPYHIQKRIDLSGTGAVCDGNTVVVEIREVETGEFRGKQFINSDGSKRFSPGMKKQGAGTFIGEKTDRLYVCEGWADAVVVHIVTGQQTFFALDANTLPATANQLKAKGFNVVVAADNDEAGRKAVKAAGLPYVIPPVVKDWWDLWNSQGDAAVRAAVATTTSPNALQLFSHVLDINLEPPSFIIDGILPKYASAALVAPSYTGKSFMAVDMACSIATGHDFHGHAVEQGGVMYILGEGRQGIRRRAEAWAKDRGVQLDRKNSPLHFSNSSIDMRDRTRLEVLRDDVSKVKDVKLIVIDTLARNFGGGNENAPQDMGEFVSACDELMHAFEATVLIVHHHGKDGAAGARGHSSFFAALDTSMVMRKFGEHDVQLICDKQKDATPFEPMQFCFVTIDETSVLHRVDYRQRKNTEKLSAAQQLAMDTFKEATKSKPEPCRIHLDEWRPIFLQRHTGDNDKSKNDAFSRARRDLVAKGLLTAKDDYYSLGDKATSGDNL
ncbi:AAA family ATPase [Roseobacter sp. HKCC-CH-9351]|uniref:AAA family ATPase n=1 Tax=Roseobacter sp. HKCC-CH-9351 TaxID=3120341 RepID=UPI0030ECC822